MITNACVSNYLLSQSIWLLYNSTVAYWSSNVCERVSENTRASAVQTQLERSCRKLIYTTGWSFFTTIKGRRGCKSNRGAEKTPSGKVYAYWTQECWPNEFMTAELISCAIKVLRFFPCNTNGFTKLIEPLTISINITMFCGSIDLRTEKLCIRDSITTYLMLSSRGTSGIVCPVARWEVPAQDCSSCRRIGGCGQTCCNAVCVRPAPGCSPR